MASKAEIIARVSAIRDKLESIRDELNELKESNPGTLDAAMAQSVMSAAQKMSLSACTLASEALSLWARIERNAETDKRPKRRSPKPH